MDNNDLVHDVKIIVAGHKPYWMPSDSCYIPVQAGSKGKKSIPNFTRDDEGENISEKNPNYCELTALYWAWKNLDSEWLGLVHYRRYFRGSCGLDSRARIATKAEIAAALTRELVVLPKPRNYVIESNWSQYAHAHHEQDLIKTREVLCRHYPAYVEKFDEVMARSWGHRFNMFVMNRVIADAWCEWLFDVLRKLEGQLDISGYSPNDARIYGFISERLIDVWLEVNDIRYSELPVVNLESQHWAKKGLNFLKRKLLPAQSNVARS